MSYLSRSVWTGRTPVRRRPCRPARAPRQRRCPGHGPELARSRRERPTRAHRRRIDRLYLRDGGRVQVNPRRQVRLRRDDLPGARRLSRMTPSDASTVPPPKRRRSRRRFVALEDAPHGARTRQAARGAYHVTPRHPRPATSDKTRKSGPSRADSRKEQQLAARSRPSPPRRTSPTAQSKQQASRRQRTIAPVGGGVRCSDSSIAEIIWGRDFSRLPWVWSSSRPASA